MLNGTMLAESPPDRLIQQHNCETLEEVFLKLCLMRKDLSEDPDENENENEICKTNNKQLANYDTLKAEERPMNPSKPEGTIIEMTETKYDDTHRVKENGTKHIGDDCTDVDVVHKSSSPPLRLKIHRCTRSYVELPKISRIYALFFKSLLFFVRHPG